MQHCSHDMTIHTSSSLAEDLRTRTVKVYCNICGELLYITELDLQTLESRRIFENEMYRRFRMKQGA